MVRTVHSSIHIIFKKLGIFQKNSKLFDYIIFVIAAIFMLGTSFANPDYAPLTSLLSNYMQANTPNEIAELDKVRDLLRVV